MSGSLPYIGILVAAIVEGEVAYVGACTLVAAGQLHPLAVVLAGAVGAAVGDQAYFYLFRRRLARWVARFPSLERKTAPLVNHVHRHATMMVLLIRFAPGLRVAIAAACAYIDMAPLRFSILNSITAVIWAVSLLVLVGWVGPASLARFGLSGWQAALLTGVILVVLFKLLSRFEQKSMTGGEQACLLPDGDQPSPN